MKLSQISELLQRGAVRVVVLKVLLQQVGLPVRPHKGGYDACPADTWAA